MRRGFTLVEMLVVIGILAILIAASLGSYNAFVRKASRARCVELVSNVQTALEAVMQKEKAWPRAVLAAEGAPNAGILTKEVGGALAKRGALSLSYRKVEQEDGSTHYELTGNDRFGIVSPWAMDVIKRNSSVSSGTAVPSGGTIEAHRLRFAVDADYDGITEVHGEVEGGGKRVRASACVWCCGYDGKFGTQDDVRSWSKDQEEK